MKNKIKTIIILLMCLNTNLSIFSQKLDTPLVPFDKKPTKDNLGFLLGFGQNVQGGKYLVECKECEFRGGVGSNFTIGAYYEQDIETNLYLGLLGTFSIMNIESKFTEKEKLGFLSKITNNVDSISIDFLHTGTAKFSYLSLTPFVRWQPAKMLFVRVGPSISFVMSNNITHVQEPVNPIVTLSTGETGRLSPGTGYSSTLEDGVFPNVISPQIGLWTDIGLNIPLSKKVTFCPVFNYNLPLTKMSSFGEDFKISTWRILLEIRIRLYEELPPQLPIKK
jgi:hypothetical protein